MGRAVDGDLCVVVAFYEPPGNMEGSFGDNVLRMGSAVRERKSKELKGFVPPPPGEFYGNLSRLKLEILLTDYYTYLLSLPLRIWWTSTQYFLLTIPSYL